MTTSYTFRDQSDYYPFSLIQNKDTKKNVKDWIWDSQSNFQQRIKGYQATIKFQQNIHQS